MKLISKVLRFGTNNIYLITKKNALVDWMLTHKSLKAFQGCFPGLKKEYFMAWLMAAKDPNHPTD